MPASKIPGVFAFDLMAMAEKAPDFPVVYFNDQSARMFAFGRGGYPGIGSFSDLLSIQQPDTTFELCAPPDIVTNNRP